MRNLLVNLIFRILSPRLHKRINSKKAQELFDNIAEDQSLQDLPEFLMQCVEEARNNFMYTENRLYKGKATAFLLLREKIINSRKVLEKNKSRTKDKKTKVKY